MAFVIRLQTTNYKKKRTERRDPFTGLGLTDYVDTGLNEIERRAIVALLLRKGGRRPGIDDRVHLTLPDGTLAEVHLVGLYTAPDCFEGHLSAESLSMPLLQLAVELATEGRLMLHPQGFPRPLVVSEKHRQELHVRYPRVQAAFSSAMIWNLLVPRSVAPAPAVPAE